MDLVSFVKAELGFVDDPFGKISLNLFCAGCPFSCDGCQNPELKDPEYGTFFSSRDLWKKIKELVSSPIVESVVFLGGDWVIYSEVYFKISKKIRKLNKKTILYTGELFENLSPSIKQASDIIIDGKWNKNTTTGSFPPSSNQRVFVNGKEENGAGFPLAKRLRELGRKNANDPNCS